MIDLSKLTARLDTIQHNIKELQNEQYHLNQQICKLRAQNDVEEFNNWQIDVGSNIIMIAKDFISEFYAIKTFSTNSINFDSMYFSGISGCYQTSGSYNICKDHIAYSSLLDLKSSYNIYAVEPSTYEAIQKDLCNLTANTVNMEEFESSVSSRALRKIS